MRLATSLHWNSGPRQNLTKTELGNSKEVQLYNVVDDPSEKKNVAKENPEKTQELEKILMAEKNKFEKTCKQSFNI